MVVDGASSHHLALLIIEAKTLLLSALAAEEQGLDLHDYTKQSHYLCLLSLLDPTYSS